MTIPGIPMGSGEACSYRHISNVNGPIFMISTVTSFDVLNNNIHAITKDTNRIKIILMTNIL